MGLFARDGRSRMGSRRELVQWPRTALESPMDALDPARRLS